MDIGPSLPPGFKLQTGRSADSDNSRKEIGPLIPPGFQRRVETSDSDSRSEESESNDETMPTNRQRGTLSLGTHKHHDKRELGSDKGENGHECDPVGPVLPPNLAEKHHSKTNSPSSRSSLVIGPALPPVSIKERGGPALSSDSSDDLHGPALPPHMLSQHATSRRCVIGSGHLPQAQQDIQADNSDDSDDVIGPRLPSSTDVDNRSTVHDIERRAQAMRDRLTNKDSDPKVPQRESWMTELPTSMKQDLGLTARTFRSGPASAAASRNDNDEDRSMWTDTPADRERKEKEGSATSSSKRKRSKDKHTYDRDKRLAKEVEKYNKEKRGDSLMAMHQKKMDKKKNKEKEKSNERREFDREKDLLVNRFDDAQRRALIKKSQELNTRFGHGASQFM